MLQGAATSQEHEPRDPSSALLPAGVRFWLLTVLGIVLAGAGLLAYLRGPAILLDLSGMASLFCL